MIFIFYIYILLFLPGGEDRSCSYNIVEKYNPRKDQWTFAPSLKRRRAGAGVTECDGKIFVAGEFHFLLLQFILALYGSRKKSW